MTARFRSSRPVGELIGEQLSPTVVDRPRDFVPDRCTWQHADSGPQDQDRGAVRKWSQQFIDYLRRIAA